MIAIPSGVRIYLAAADRFDVSRALIYLWRKHVRAGLMPGVTISAAGAAAFAPVALVPDTPAHVAPASAERPNRGRRHAGLIEVRLVKSTPASMEDSGEGRHP